MAGALAEDREFERAESIEYTPEQKEATRAHFEKKGMDVSFEDDEPEQPAEDTPPAEPAEDTQPVVEQPPQEEQPAVTQPVADPDVDDDSRTEFQAAKNDGEKLGRWAKKNKELREAKTGLAEKEGTIAELRRQLAERDKTPTGQTAPPPTTLIPPAETTKPAATAPTPTTQAKTFDKARPTPPKFEDYQNEDDPLAAHQNAMVQHVNDVLQWDREGRDFERTQQQEQEAQRQSRQRDIDHVNSRIQAASQKYPDFKTRIDSVQFGGVLQHLLSRVLPDGMDLAYDLTKPEHQQFFNDLRSSVNVAVDDKGMVTEEPASVAEKIALAREQLGGFRERLKYQTPTPPAATPPPPAATRPAATAPPAQQTPPAAAQPRREEPSPPPARGRTAAAMRIEDIDPMDSDARRRLRKQNGEM